MRKRLAKDVLSCAFQTVPPDVDGSNVAKDCGGTGVIGSAVQTSGIAVAGEVGWRGRYEPMLIRHESAPAVFLGAWRAEPVDLEVEPAAHDSLDAVALGSLLEGAGDVEVLCGSL